MVAIIKLMDVDTSVFVILYFEEPPIYNRTDMPQIRDCYFFGIFIDVLRTSLPNAVPPRRPGDSPIVPTIVGATSFELPAFKTSNLQNLKVNKQVTDVRRIWIFTTIAITIRCTCGPSCAASFEWTARLEHLAFRDEFGILNPEQLFDKLCGAKMFTKIDWAQDIINCNYPRPIVTKVRLPRDTASFEWTVVPFGLPSVPSIFQRILGNVLFEVTYAFIKPEPGNVVPGPYGQIHRNHSHIWSNTLLGTEIF